MGICSKINPCCCLQSSNVSPTPPPCSDLECCLRVCDTLLSSIDAVGPCGQVGTFDLATLNHRTDGCTANPVFYLESFDNTFFVDVSISLEGVVTWTTLGASTVNDYSKVYYRMECDADCVDGIELKSLGHIEIGVKDDCQGVNCNAECETCNPCTGVCDPTVTEISINGGTVNIIGLTSPPEITETTAFTISGSPVAFNIPVNTLVNSIVIVPSQVGAFTVGTTNGGNDVIDDTIADLTPQVYDINQFFNVATDLYFGGNGTVTVYITQ